MEIERFDIYWVNLDPTIGSELQKSRPAVIISPNEMNSGLNTVIIAPITSTIKKYPTRVNIELQRKKGQVALDQIRTIDKQRLNKRITRIANEDATKIIETLQVMFAE